MRRALVACVSVACGNSAQPPAVTLSPVASATTTAFVTAAPVERTGHVTLGAFSFDYDPKMFPKLERTNDGITITSLVSEDYNGVHTFSMSFAFAPSAFGVLRQYIDPQTAKKIFPDGTMKSFVEEPGFVHRDARGYYVLTMGVEGIGDVIHAIEGGGGGGRVLRVDCNYCCGLTEKPKLTSDQQLAICGTVIDSIKW